MSTTNHTPTPWYAANWTCHAPVTVLIDDATTLLGKRVIAECETEEDAAFIVQACNSHAQLVKALREIAGDAAASAEDGDAEAAMVALGDIARLARAALSAAGVV